jgi:SAM-dependent methyltransferase
MKNLTDKQFWAKYWSTKKATTIVTSRYAFQDLFNEILTKKIDGTMLEVGGFPGYFAVFFHKFWGYKTTLLDYFVDKKFLSKVWSANSIKSEAIKVIESDFFSYTTKTQYDLVFSLGFIEHFDDTSDVISRHWRLVAKGGELLIVYPNFLGLNGHMQLAWDPDNLNKHNLESMYISRIKNYLKDLKISNAKVFYWGGLRVWLEDLPSRSLWQKFVVVSLYALGLLIKSLGFNSKFLSPYIVIYAIK